MFLIGINPFQSYLERRKSTAALTKEDMKKEIELWLVTTDHLKDGVWFREEEDFKVGMNYVAVIAAGSPVYILAFILMSNHVHFLFLGSREEAEAFIDEFKRRYSNYVRIKYGTAKFLKKNGVDIQLIPFDGESAERALAYIQMNCVAANICLHATQYPWGTGNLFFNATPPSGTRVDTLSDRERMRLTRSKTRLPGHWLIGNEGYILPSSYVRTDYVERLFRNPKRMDYFLKNSSKARLRLQSGEESQPSFKDQTLLSVLPELCFKLFGVSSFRELGDSQKTVILRQLRFRFSSNTHQLARVVGISYEEAARLMDSK